MIKSLPLPREQSRQSSPKEKHLSSQEDSIDRQNVTVKREPVEDSVPARPEYRDLTSKRVSAPRPASQWTLSNAKIAVKHIAFHVNGGFLYPLKELQKGNCPKGLVEWILCNYNSIETFAAIVQLPIRGDRKIPHSQYAWSEQQIASILKEVAKTEGIDSLPTNACLRDRGLRWVEMHISGRSEHYSKLTGLKRTTFSQRAARRDRKSYHKTWTLPEAIRTTRELAQKLNTGGFMPTQKQYRANRLNWLSSLISQKFGGIQVFANNCGLKLRRMSQGRKLRKPRHLLKRAARTSKGLKMLWEQLSIPGQGVTPAQLALVDMSTGLNLKKRKRQRDIMGSNPYLRPHKRIKLEPLSEDLENQPRYGMQSSPIKQEIKQEPP